MGSRLARPAGCGLAEATQQGACTNGRCFRRIAKRQLVRGEAGRGLRPRITPRWLSAAPRAPLTPCGGPAWGPGAAFSSSPPSDTRSQPACGSPQGPGPRGWSLTSVPGTVLPLKAGGWFCAWLQLPPAGLGGHEQFLTGLDFPVPNLLASGPCGSHSTGHLLV